MHGPDYTPHVLTRRRKSRTWSQSAYLNSIVAKRR
jgi:hypothetical protein